jgi:hypothetical protein
VQLLLASNCARGLWHVVYSRLCRRFCRLQVMKQMDVRDNTVCVCRVNKSMVF